MRNTIMVGNALEKLREIPEKTIQTVVTSPPYWRQRVYDGMQHVVWGGAPDCNHDWKPFIPEGFPKEDIETDAYICSKCGANLSPLGMEPELDCLSWARQEPPCNRCYVCHIRMIFAEMRRVLKDDGTVWFNIGDSYAGSKSGGGELKKQSKGWAYCKPYARWEEYLKPKDMCLVPFHIAMALRADGWVIRSDIIWAKKVWLEKEGRDIGESKPESVNDRPAHVYEHVFLITKKNDYYYDWMGVEQYSSWAESTKPVPKRMVNVWHLRKANFTGAHFAVMPNKLAELCIKLGTSDAGECSVCGKSWIRVIERAERIPIRAYSRNTGKKAMMRPESPTSTLKTKEIYRYESKGFSPQCNCGAPAVPNIVLDPFAGTGTTLLTAKLLGRDFIGIEISEEYIKLAQQRLGLLTET